MNMNKLLRFILTVALVLHSASLFAAACQDVFPDAVQNSTNSGRIDFGWRSRIYNSPDNILDTTQLNDGSGGVSCDGSACAISGSRVPAEEYNGFSSGQADISLGYQQQRTITPGEYNSVNLDYQAELTLTPGDYYFYRDFSMGSESRVYISAPGTVRIYVREDISLGNLASFNPDGGTRYALLYARGDVDFTSNSQAQAIVYARGDVVLNNNAFITGAITSRSLINLSSRSFVSYDADKVANTDFDTFCEGNPDPVVTLIAEWRLDELQWTGASNEVLDQSGNGLHGRAINNNGLPTTETNNPVVSGNPGTCQYGQFNGTQDGYVLINDPGNNSILDLTDEFTVMNWFYAYTYPSSGLATIVSKDENFEYHLQSNGRINWWWGGGSRALSSNTSASTNRWHHVAITYKSSGEQIIYLDGVSVGQTNYVGNATANNDGVHIGTDWNYHSRRFNGLIDEVRIYEGAMNAAQVGAAMSETHPCVFGATLSYFQIDVGGGQASVCSPYEVTITARDSSHATITNYAGEIALSTSTGHGDWQNTGDAGDAINSVQPIGTDTGGATYSFDTDDDGSITLALSNEHAETLTVTVEDDSVGVVSSSSAITFSENAFVITDNDVLGDDVIAGRRHQFLAQMMKRDSSTGVCGPAENYDVASVKVWIDRDAADPGGLAPEASNADQSQSAALGNAAPANAILSFPFIDGEALFSLNTSDVGQYSIEFLDDSLAFSDQAIAGSSNLLTVRPFAFKASVVGNPAAVDAGGSAFMEAGSTFTVNLEAIGYGGATEDSNNNGRPDVYEDSDPANNLSLSGAALPGFGRESSSESVTLSVQLHAPVGGNNPGLLPDAAPEITGFTNGAASISGLRFGEVGIVLLEVQLSGGSYLNAGSTRTARSESVSRTVGRFYPSVFESLADPDPYTLSPACGTGGFSYLGQGFSTAFQLQALNVQGDVTQNYEGDFARFDAATALSHFAVDLDAPTDLSARQSVSNAQGLWAAGVGSLEYDVQIARASAPDGPFTDARLGVRVVDSDGVRLRNDQFNLDTDDDATDDALEVGETALYFGRLRLSDAAGPETAELPVDLHVEYWNGQAWQRQLDDSCTGIAQTDIVYPEGSIDDPANRSVALGGGATTGLYTDDSAGLIHFSAGDAGHRFTAPGQGNTGAFAVGIDMSAYPWLRFDWNQDGDYDNDLSLPDAEIRFGSYRGHDRIIYWQELFSN